MYHLSFSILNCFVIFLHLFHCYYFIVPCHLNLGLPSVCMKVYFYPLCEVSNITKLCAIFSVAGYENYVNVRHCHENISYQHSGTDCLTLGCFISCDLVFVCKESVKGVGSLREIALPFSLCIYLFCVRSVEVRRCNENTSGQDDVYWWCPQ
jgi:hypothetical protein